MHQDCQCAEHRGEPHVTHETGVPPHVPASGPAPAEDAPWIAPSVVEGADPTPALAAQLLPGEPARE